jgi:hypothetical protein
MRRERYFTDTKRCVGYQDAAKMAERAPTHGQIEETD